MDGKLNLEDLGYDDFFGAGHVDDGLAVGRVIAQHKEAYRVKNANGEYLAKITGRFMFNALSREDYPAVGDWVTVSGLDEQPATIHQVLPRKTMIKRKANGKNDIQVIAANIDAAFVIESVDRDYNLNRLERYFAIVRNEGIRPAVILNKVDLISADEATERINEIKNRFDDVDFIATSTVSNEGLDALSEYIEKGKTYCFLGSSGVGKSSLINMLIGRQVIKTGPISTHTDRGRHTTTAREMYFLADGGIVIDNPGMREVGVTDVSEGINDVFDEITSLAADCKYSDCSHTHEAGCAVLEAVEDGRLDRDKYENYIGLKNEAEHYEMTERQRKNKGRQFGKFIKNAKKQLKRYGHKDY